MKTVRHPSPGQRAFPLARRLGCVLTSLFVVALLWSANALAQTSVLILVRGQDSPQLQAYEQRLRLELTAEGYASATVNVSADPNAAVLLDTAKRLTSSAAISISLTDGVVSGMVWIVDPKKPGGLLRAVTDLPVSDQAPAVFAIAATDALHGGLLELGYMKEDTPKPEAPAIGPKSLTGRPPTLASATPPKSQEPPPVAAAKPVPQPDTTRPKKWDHRDGWFLSLGANRSIPLGDLASSTEFDGTTARRLGTSFGIGFHASYGLPFQLREEVSGATATLLQATASGRLQLIQGVGRRLTLFEQVDTGLHYFSLSGQAPPPMTNVASRRFTIYHELGVGGVLNVNADFGIWFGTSLRLPYKPTEVIIVDEVVGRVAGPTLLLGGGLQIRLF